MAQVRTLERRLALRRDTGRTPINLGRASLRQVIDPAVAAVFDVEIADLRAPTRSSPQAAYSSTAFDRATIGPRNTRATIASNSIK